jgi:hypothetical protein
MTRCIECFVSARAQKLYAVKRKASAAWVCEDHRAKDDEVIGMLDIVSRPMARVGGYDDQEVCR